MSDSATAAAKAPGLKTLLKNRNFLFVWLAQAISDFGDSLTSIALLFLINSLTGSAAAIATVFVLLTIPQITFGLVAGVYVDRLDRKQIMIISDLLRGLLVFGFVFVRSADTLWLLYLLAFVQASIGTFFTPARSALLPNIVSKEELLAANSVSQTSRIIFGLLGTAAAGVLIGTFGVFWPAFSIDALTFFVSVVLVSRVFAARTRAESSGERANVKAIFAQLVDGMKIIAHTPALMGTLVAAAIAMLGVGAVNVLLVPLIVNDLHVSASWFGVVEFAQTSSMILSGSLVAILASRIKPASIISGAMVGIGITLALLAAVSSIWHLLLILFLVGWIMTPMQASIATLMQTSVDDKLRGRTGASLNTLVSTASLVSMALAGVLAGGIGVRNVFLLGGAVVVLAGLASALVFRGITRPGATTTTTAETSSTPLPGEAAS